MELIRRMVNALPEPVLNFAYHLPKPWNDRFTHVNGKQSLFLACENIRFSSLFAAGNVSHGGNAPSGEERGETDVFAGHFVSGEIHKLFFSVVEEE